MSRLFLLQSGFVTSNTSFLVKEKDQELSLRDRLFMNDSRLSDSDGYYDETVERLFQLFHKDDQIIRKFEFREEILASAFRVFKFNSISIFPWLKLQLTQRTVGYLHRRYLKESLIFALYGNEKSLENYSYYRLLCADIENNNLQTGSDNPDEDLRNFIHSDASANITDIITSWTKDTLGFIDLLTTMHVIFGRRPVVTSSK